MKKLHLPQEVHVQRLLKVLAAQNSAADMSPCGLGKTICAAEVARLLKRPLFVVAPLSTLPAWREELEERGVPATVVNYEKLRSKKNGWVAKSKFGQWVWNLPSKTIIVFDEFQQCKSPTSIISRIAIATRPHTSLLLSGSLAESPVHMRASGYLLGLHDLRSFGRWAKERGCHVDQWGKLVFNDDEKILNQLHHDIIPAHGSQMTFEEMKAFMPNNQVIFEAIDFGDKGAISHFYEEMEVELAALEEIVEGDRKGAEALTAQLRARQKVELLKIPLLAERAAALAAEGNSVIVFLTYAASIDALSERLGGVPIIDGRHGDREAVIQGFRTDRTPIIAVNVAAGGAGINLHGKRPRRAILTPDFNPISILQSLGRAPRVGGADVVQFVLTARGTVEDGVTTSLKQKMKNIAIIHNGLPEKNPQVSDKTVDPETPLAQNEPAMAKQPTAQETAIPEKDHAEYNPSSLASFERCPGYLNREGETNPIAERGTRIHDALEHDTVAGLVEEEQPIAQKCCDFIDGLLADYLPAQPTQEFREIKLPIDLGGGLSTFGTCDRLFLFGPHGEMIDYKSGYLEVSDAEYNPQAWGYVIGAFQRFPELQEINFTFLIPVRDQVSFHLFKRSAMPSMKLRLNTIITRAKQATEDQYRPQAELCEYCGRQATCPVLAANALKLGGKLRDDLLLPENPLASIDRPEDIPHLLRLAPLMEAWATNVRGEALRLTLEEGLEIPGFRRYERSTGRAVSSVIGAYEAVKDVLSLDEFLAACGTVSVPDLEEVFAERARKDASKKRGRIGAARQDLENRLRDADVLKEPGTIFFLREKKA